MFNLVKKRDLDREFLKKNSDIFLDVMGENMEGARLCPLLKDKSGALPRKCIGKYCEFFMEFYSIGKDGNKTEYWRCAYVQTPLLLIELKQTIGSLKEVLKNDKTNN